MNVIPETARYKGGPADEQIAFITRTSFWDTDNILGGGYGAVYRKQRNGEWRKMPNRARSHEESTDLEWRAGAM